MGLWRWPTLSPRGHGCLPAAIQPLAPALLPRPKPPPGCVPAPAEPWLHQHRSSTQRTRSGLRRRGAMLRDSAAWGHIGGFRGCGAAAAQIHGIVWVGKGLLDCPATPGPSLALSLSQHTPPAGPCSREVTAHHSQVSPRGTRGTVGLPGGNRPSCGACSRAGTGQAQRAASPSPFPLRSRELGERVRPGQPG